MTIINETTGEITAAPTTALVPDDDANRFAALCDEVRALEMQRADRIAELQVDDEELKGIDSRLWSAQTARDAILARWDDAFADAEPGTAIDTPRLRVLKPKGRESWRLRQSAKELGSHDARCELGDILCAMLPGEPGVEIAALTDAVIAWLGPERTVSEPGALRITVRPPKGGGS